LEITWRGESPLLLLPRHSNFSNVAIYSCVLILLYMWMRSAGVVYTCLVYTCKVSFLSFHHKIPQINMLKTTIILSQFCRLDLQNQGLISPKIPTRLLPHPFLALVVATILGVSWLWAALFPFHLCHHMVFILCFCLHIGNSTFTYYVAQKTVMFLFT
jgi:hypothetical protein